MPEELNIFSQTDESGATSDFYKLYLLRIEKKKLSSQSPELSQHWSKLQVAYKKGNRILIKIS